MITVTFIFVLTLLIGGAGGYAYSASRRTLRETPSSDKRLAAAAEWADVFREVVVAADGVVSEDVEAGLKVMVEREARKVPESGGERLLTTRVQTLENKFEGYSGAMSSAIAHLHRQMVNVRGPSQRLESRIDMLSSAVASVTKAPGVLTAEMPLLLGPRGETVIGEQTRGGVEVGQGLAEIFKTGALSPVLTEITKTIARRGPLSLKDVRKTPVEYVPYAFSVHGEKNTTKTIHIQPQAYFKPAEMFADDTSSRPGHGTQITSVFVGQRPAYVVQSGQQGIPTWMFREWVTDDDLAIMEEAAKLFGTEYETEASREAASRLRILRAASKIPWTTCQTSFTVSITVSFDETCKFEGVLWGWRLP